MVFKSTKLFYACILMMMFFCITGMAIAQNFIPSLGFGYDSKTGESIGRASPWFDPMKVDSLTQCHNVSIDRRFENFVENIDELVEATNSSVQVQVKSALFGGQGSFSQLSNNAINKRSMVYLLIATRLLPCQIMRTEETLTDRSKSLIKDIEGLSLKNSRELEKAKELYKRMTDSNGPEYVTEVTRRAYIAIVYRFEASSESHLRQIKADLGIRTGSVSGTIAFDTLRQRNIKGLNYSVDIIAEGVADVAFQSIDLWKADVNKIQEFSLKKLQNSDVSIAPIAKYNTSPLWKVLALPSQISPDSLTSWFLIEEQRNSFLKDLYRDYLILKDNEAVLANLSVVPELADKKVIINQERDERAKSIALIREYANKANQADNLKDLDVIQKSKPNFSDSIDYAKILPKDLTSLIRVISFTADVGASYQGAPNGWAGYMNVGFRLSSPISYLIENISLSRIENNNIIMNLYIGPYIDFWQQPGANRLTGYMQIGGGGVDYAQQAKQYFISYFRQLDYENDRCKYELSINLKFGNPISIILPKWSAI